MKHRQRANDLLVLVLSANFYLNIEIQNNFFQLFGPNCRFPCRHISETKGKGKCVKLEKGWKGDKKRNKNIGEQSQRSKQISNEESRERNYHLYFAQSKNLGAER